MPSFPLHAQPDVAPPNGGVPALHLEVKFERDGKPIASDRLPSKPAIDLILLSGVAGPFGRARDVDLPGNYSAVDALDLDPNDWMAIAWARARPLGKSLPADVVLTPAETRVGTVLAQAYTSGSGRLGPRRIGKWQSSFIRFSRNRYASLTFFDRPCKLTGTWIEGDSRAQLDLRIPAAGFYLLTFTPDSPGRLRISVETTPLQGQLVLNIR